MPQTVPKSPMKGAAEPTEARKVSPCSRRRRSALMAWRRARSKNSSGELSVREAARPWDRSIWATAVSAALVILPQASRGGIWASWFAIACTLSCCQNSPRKRAFWRCSLWSSQSLSSP
ncbi:hypothetical protein D3C86_1412000 [compost metagenome]